MGPWDAGVDVNPLLGISVITISIEISCASNFAVQEGKRSSNGDYQNYFYRNVSFVPMTSILVGVSVCPPRVQ